MTTILQALDRTARESGPELFEELEGAALCYNLLWRACAMFVADERLRRLTAQGMLRALGEIADEETSKSAQRRSH